jgi:hypothetical protein
MAALLGIPQATPTPAPTTGGTPSPSPSPAPSSSPASGYTGPGLGNIGSQSQMNAYMNYYLNHPNEDPGFSDISRFHGDPWKDEDMARSVLSARNQYLQSNPTPAPSSNPTPAATIPAATPQSQTDALSNWANSGGYQYLLNQGINGINADRSAKGLLQSGSTATGVTRMANGLAQTYLNQYMQQLQNYGQLGLGSAGVLASAGQHSEGTGTSTETSKGAKQGLLGDIAQGVGAYAAMGSDVRMKMNIEHIGEYKNGLNKYRFEYKDNPGVKVIGAMAHEVKEIMPEAYIENFKDGYAGVDYSYFKGL